MDSSVTNTIRVLRVAHHGVVTAWRQRERELLNLQVDLTLVSAKRWNEGGREVELDAGEDRFVTALPTFGTHPNAFLYSPVPLWRLLGQEWDLLDLHEEPCSLATAQVLAMRKLRGLRTPFVLYSAQNINKRYPPPFRWFERYALRRAAGVYVCNTEAGTILRRKGLRAPAQLIGLGADISIFTPSARSQPQTPLRVGYAGRLEARKGLGVLLDAVSQLSECKLDIAGDGPQRAELETIAKKHGIAGRVTFLGHLGNRLPEFYRGLDVLVVPSLPTAGWLEQFGRVVVEAFASGVPVIASRSGALPDVVSDAGMLVDPGNAQEIRDALTEVTRPVRWSELRNAGLRRSRQFDWPAVAAAQRSFYEEALSSAGGYPDSHELPQVVIVAYGPAEPLDEALRPLREFSLTVVDNSSSLETRAIAERNGAHYIDPGSNLGFAAGVNLALDSLADRGLDGTDVLLLNPDATVSPQAIRSLQSGLHQRPSHACVAPVQQHPTTGEPERVSWPFPSPAAAWLDAAGLGRLNRRSGFVIGSVLLLRASALADVGQFDERFFLYAEETDWQLRAVARGWTTGMISEASATHVGAGTGGDSIRRMEMFNTSLLAFMDKHHGRFGKLSYRAAVLSGAIVRSVLARGATRDQARWRLKFYTRMPSKSDVRMQPSWT